MVALGVVAERDLDHGRAEPRLELGCRALGDHRAVVDHHDAIGEVVGLFEVLGGEQHGRAALDQALDHPPQLVATLRVETGGRFVEEQDRRLVDQRRGEVEPTPHAAGVGARHPVGRVRERETSEEIVSPSFDLGPRQVRELADQAQVLAAGEVLVDCGVLAGQTDRRPDPLRVLLHVDPQHAGAAAVGGGQGGEHAHDGGLARAVGPEQAEHLALRHLEGDALDRLDLTEVLHQAVGHDRRRPGAVPTGSASSCRSSCWSRAPA